MISPVFKLLHGPVYRKRIKVLSTAILPHLQSGDRVLDVGCGFGALGRALMDHPQSPEGLEVTGLERAKRGGEAIPVEAYDGVKFPFEDDTYDAVILADVLHHEQDPDRLLSEASRVARRLVIIKDHKPDGVFAQRRISLMDWAANTAYGVPCLYRYNTLAQWRESHARQGLSVVCEHEKMRLYPWPYGWFFTPALQYLAVLGCRDKAEAR